MTPDRIILTLAPIIGRCRTSDHWIVPRGGSSLHRRTPATNSLWVNHALRLHRIGLCPIERGSNTTRLALLDLDSHKGEVDWLGMSACAKKLIAAGAGRDVRFIPFRSSGGRGIHLFALWDAPQDAHSVRVMLREVLGEVGMRPGVKGGVAAGVAECFPKQSHVPADGWGNMFVVPMSGDSEALSPDDLTIIDLAEVRWPTSKDVQVVEATRPRLPPPAEADAPGLDTVRSALFAIDPNDVGYGGEEGQVGWLELLFATHSATRGSDAGMALFLEWCEGWNRYDPDASAAHTVENWRAAKLREDGIGVGTLLSTARRSGWDDGSTGPEGFAPIEHPLVLTDRHPAAVYDGTDGFYRIETLAERTGLDGKMSEVEGWLRPRTKWLAFDNFNMQVVVDEGNGDWRPWDDTDITKTRVMMERAAGFKSVGKEVVRDAVYAVARDNEVDTARDWLDSLPEWDGVPRVDRLMADYFSSERDDDYAMYVSRYLLTAIVGRITVPGCQADMVPVLVGEQGLRKTQGIKALLPSPDHYVEIDLSRRDEDQARLMRGKLIGEIAELRGLASRDNEAIKAWITRSHEEWTPKYIEHSVRMARRLIFIGSTNQDDFLADPTGARRWLPIRVGTVDRDAIVRDRDQLFAEARTMYMVDGIAWDIPAALKKEVEAEFRNQDPLTEPVYRVFVKLAKPLTTFEVAEELGVELGSGLVRGEAGRRLGRVLRDIGCRKSRRRRDGRLVWEWLPPEDIVPDTFASATDAEGFL